MLAALPRPLQDLLTKERATAALHEAAHVVVGVRCGMPLLLADITSALVRTPGGLSRAGGLVAYDIDAVEATLGDEAPRARTVFAAAGICAERAMARARNVSVNANRSGDDEERVARYARVLGIPASGFKAFREALCADALQRLLDDAGGAWLRVTRALEAEHAVAGARLPGLVTGTVTCAEAAGPHADQRDVQHVRGMLRADLTSLSRNHGRPAHAAMSTSTPPEPHAPGR